MYSYVNLSLFVGSLVDANPRFLRSLLAPWHLHLCFDGTSFILQVCLIYFFLPGLEELLGALPLLGGKFGRLGEQAKANLERVHIL